VTGQKDVAKVGGTFIWPILLVPVLRRFFVFLTASRSDFCFVAENVSVGSRDITNRRSGHSGAPNLVRRRPGPSPSGVDCKLTMISSIAAGCNSRTWQNEAQVSLQLMANVAPRPR
jgi:hypothetical protein